MATLRHGEELFTVALAESATERAAVYALREAVYVESQPHLLAAAPAGMRHRAADVYDDRSYVFACHRAGEREVVATCRFTTPLLGRWELDDLAGAWTRPPVPAERLVETSRVVVRRGWRASGLVEAMLLVAGSELLAQTSFRYNFAVCARPLVRLYARLGMKLTSTGELLLRGRPIDRRYVVIYGDMRASRPAVSARLAARGWQTSGTMTEQRDEPPQRKAGT